MRMIETPRYGDVVVQICNLRWNDLCREDLTRATWAYYYFSIQFRENLEIACNIHPNDEMLQHLKREECDTSNLSPWLGVAEIGERMNHDEFMRRLLRLSPVAEKEQAALEKVGEEYLGKVRAAGPAIKAASIASYEDGGLESVFNAILQAPYWDTPLLQAFRHFLTEHIKFDSDPEQGHGALSRHLAPNDEITPLWVAFRDLFLGAVPKLGQPKASHGLEDAISVAGAA